MNRAFAFEQEKRVCRTNFDKRCLSTSILTIEGQILIVLVRRTPA